MIKPFKQFLLLFVLTSNLLPAFSDDVNIVSTEVTAQGDAKVLNSEGESQISVASVSDDVLYCCMSCH